jgi:hypothetical protein
MSKAVTRAEWQSPLPEEVPDPIGRGIPVGFTPSGGQGRYPDSQGIASAFASISTMPDCRVNLKLQRHRTKQVSADGEVSYTKDVIPYWTEKADTNILEIAEIMGGEDDMGLPLQPMVDQVERSRPHRCESCGLQYAEEAEMVACCFYDPRRRHG